MNPTARLGAIVTLLILPLPALAAPIHAILYKNPQCGCCDAYAAYLRKNGFDVDIKPTTDLAQIASKAGVPDDLAGCHTIFVDGYVVDGLVPIDVVHKLLTERPAITGVTLPGMPPGAPGMGNSKMAPLKIYAFTKDGKAPSVYAIE
ncbi:MAG TPA: DUF411 domain-containing protein [Beijerinckiaceae bacterium]|nr:DUF411 domain-containing protein [Beijerinckiaceae bacterium]HVB89189.1 DUF411 domain-containing protein [Beijerinckiaceae bacterium]